MGTFLQIILQPRKALERIAARPRWVGAFALLALAHCGLLLATHAESVRLTLSHLPPSVTAVEIEQVRASLDEGLLLRFLFLPVRLAVGWGSFALLLMFATRSVARQPSGTFRGFLALEVHAELILLLAAVVRTVLGGAGENLLLRALLATPNLFTLWYIVLLAYGAASICQMKFTRALLPVAGVWLLSFAFDAGVTQILRETLHLRA
jgi:hypothetical protein